MFKILALRLKFRDRRVIYNLHKFWAALIQLDVKEKQDSTRKGVTQGYSLPHI